MHHPNWDTLTPDDAQPWDTLGSDQKTPLPRRVLVDRVRTHLGEEISYTYRPRGPRAVFVFPVTGDAQAVLIREYRYPLRATVTAVVAGGMEEGEDVQAAAARELAEEAGGRAQEWVPLPGFYPQPSFSGVVFLPFLALGTQLDAARPERDELIQRLTVPLARAYQMLDAGEIQDGPSGLVMAHARPHLTARGLL